MMSSAPNPTVSTPGRKKVIIYRFERDRLPGYLSPSNFVRGCGEGARIELLDLAGRVSHLSLAEVKMVAFVRDFDSSDPHPERLMRKTFASRPRATGLWLRLTFRDKDSMEGLATNDLSLLEGEGVMFSPPDLRSNTQRIYAPRMALAELQVLGAIGTPARHPSGAKSSAKSPAALQEELFELDIPPYSRPN